MSPRRFTSDEPAYSEYIAKIVASHSFSSVQMCLFLPQKALVVLYPFPPPSLTL
jgi:hypothetical protein